MAENVSLDVQLIAATRFRAPADVGWEPDAQARDADNLVEFAGRACYETFDRPNPHTATNAAYLHHILEVGHTALLEHATATLYIRGLSRAASHELVRHRHFSFSQLSQRYVPAEGLRVVLPELVARDPELAQLALDHADHARLLYDELRAALEEKLAGESNALLRRKQTRQSARSVLPQATETRLVVTGNFRTWRHFIGMRATEHADVEIRSLAVACLKLLQAEAPGAFGDFDITELPDGTPMAASPYVSEA